MWELLLSLSLFWVTALQRNSCATPSANILSESPNVQGGLNVFLDARLWPSPSRGSLHIEIYGLYSTPDGPLQLQMFNVEGRKVADFSHELEANSNGHWSKFLVDVSSLPCGIYFLRLDASGSQLFRKFMLVR
jgi:hypothetical protein